jgi:hypothetical protein
MVPDTIIKKRTRTREKSKRGLNLCYYYTYRV